MSKTVHLYLFFTLVHLTVWLFAPFATWCIVRVCTCFIPFCSSPDSFLATFSHICTD